MRFIFEKNFDLKGSHFTLTIYFKISLCFLDVEADDECQSIFNCRLEPVSLKTLPESRLDLKVNNSEDRTSGKIWKSNVRWNSRFTCVISSDCRTCWANSEMRASEICPRSFCPCGDQLEHQDGGRQWRERFRGRWSELRCHSAFFRASNFPAKWAGVVRVQQGWENRLLILQWLANL